MGNRSRKQRLQRSSKECYKAIPSGILAKDCSHYLDREAGLIVIAATLLVNMATLGIVSRRHYTRPRSSMHPTIWCVSEGKTGPFEPVCLSKLSAASDAGKGVVCPDS